MIENDLRERRLAIVREHMESENRHAFEVTMATFEHPEDGSAVALREQVVPRISQAPGCVAGYWTRKGNSGLSMSVWESEDAANAASGMVRSVAPEGVTVDSVEVREVVASA
jgi:hypothetical protein